MANNINDFVKCANCGACYNACPVDAIYVDGNELFYKPQVDEKKCMSCGLCKDLCPVNREKEKQCVVGAYGLIHNDEEVLKKSSSGGAFTAIAENVISKNGVVYGAVYSEDCKSVIYQCSERKELDCLRRSKYVESSVGLVFREIKEKLNEKTTVLFCGAPCQVAGLKKFLKKEYDNLITCDFSCGGMPSHKIYQQYLEKIERKLKSTIVSVNFRPKTYGWLYYTIKIKSKKGKEYNNLYMSDPYLDNFINKHYTVRDYCLQCEFAVNHCSDLILADFWKYRSISRLENQNKGISLVLTNSIKGENLIKEIQKQMSVTVLDVEKASYNLVEKKFSDEFLLKRNEFLRKCNNVGFNNIRHKKYILKKLKFKLKFRLKGIIGKY